MIKTKHRVTRPNKQILYRKKKKKIESEKTSTITTNNCNDFSTIIGAFRYRTARFFRIPAADFSLAILLKFFFFYLRLFLFLMPRGAAHCMVF